MALFAFSVGKAQTEIADRGKMKEPKREIKSSRIPLKKLEGTTVSERAMNHFGEDFPKATDAKWERSGSFDQVTFSSGDQKMTAYYDSDDNLVGSTTPKSLKDLPAKGRQEIKAKYGDYSVGPVIYFDDNARIDTDMILWASQFDDENMYFAELNKGNSKIIIKITPSGEVSFFKQLQ